MNFGIKNYLGFIVYAIYVNVCTYLNKCTTDQRLFWIKGIDIKIYKYFVIISTDILEK
jgi:hypothetical protein